MSDTFTREVDEDLRRRQLTELWQRFGPYLVAALCFAVLITAGYTFWRSKLHTVQEGATAQLAVTLQQLGQNNGAELAQTLAKDAETLPPGQAILARLYAAGLAVQTNDGAAAEAQLRAAAQITGAPPLYRDLARLQLVQLRLDSADPAELQNELSPLKEDGQAWRFSARELSALLSLKTGDIDTARAGFDALLKDKDTPAGLRERVSQQLATLPAAATP